MPGSMIGSNPLTDSEDARFRYGLELASRTCI